MMMWRCTSKQRELDFRAQGARTEEDVQTPSGARTGRCTQAQHCLEWALACGEVTLRPSRTSVIYGSRLAAHCDLCCVSYRDVFLSVR
jgi:hypothetical protein